MGRTESQAKKRSPRLAPNQVLCLSLFKNTSGCVELVMTKDPQRVLAVQALSLPTIFHLSSRKKVSLRHKNLKKYRMKVTALMKY